MISSIEIASLQQILLGSHENSHVDTEALDTSSFNIALMFQLVVYVSSVSEVMLFGK